ncbi:uncharacterized protein LOC126398148 [Epinephelus moara]|uniref:uncharacterized protein LOC126398148 n=1 Tax=Epinephelus moara TaxID=300413 RepID=UPI00214F5D1B|nr:uncharacterized protein LOC126398148 [Epinephelus moara]
MKVEAPVHKVNIQQVENRITCSSEGIYPEPQLTWSTNPPSSVILQNKTTVQQTEQQLYNINSYLIVSESAPDLVYSCTVSTRRNWRRASLFKPTSINSSDSKTTIPCTASNTPLSDLIWRFNHSQIILKQTRANVPYTVSEEWRQHVKSVSESGNLTLQDVSSDQDGIYTCELSDDKETYVTNTFLRIKKGQGQGTGLVAGIVVGVLLLVILAVLGFLLYKKYKKPNFGQSENTGKSQEEDELSGVKVPINTSGQTEESAGYE